MQLVESRGYFFCRYCGSFHFPETAADDGIRILGDAAKPLGCAVCAAAAGVGDAGRVVPGSLLPELPRRPAAAVEFRDGRAEAARLGHRATRRRSGSARSRPSSTEKLTCPVCSTRMITHPYYGPGNVVLDNCASCDLIWLDFGELKQIVAAPGRDRGSREQVLRETADTPAGLNLRPLDPPTTDAVDLLATCGALF